MFEMWRNPKNLRCGDPDCKSTRLRKDGFVHGKQRYRCKKCGKYTIIPYGLRGSGRRRN